MNELNDVTRNEAMQALVVSSEELAGVQVVYGTMCGQPFPWLLDAAIELVRHGGDFVHIIWDPDFDGPCLLLLDDDFDEIYRFTVPVDPRELAKPPSRPPMPLRNRTHLRVVRPAS